MDNNPVVSSEAEVIVWHLFDDGTFPNNASLPLVVYRGAVALKGDPARTIEQLFEAHQWGGLWRNGIYDYHHYHSTAHEVLGIVRGTARVQLGGEKGFTAELAAGDVVVIPAGVAHKNLGASDDFLVVGAYPPGQRWDMNYGRPGERPNTDRNIDRVPLPPSDPVFGDSGPLFEHWGLGTR